MLCKFSQAYATKSFPLFLPASPNCKCADKPLLFICNPQVSHRIPFIKYWTFPLNKYSISIYCKKAEDILT